MNLEEWFRSQTVCFLQLFNKSIFWLIDIIAMMIFIFRDFSIANAQFNLKLHKTYLKIIICKTPYVKPLWNVLRIQFYQHVWAKEITLHLKRGWWQSWVLLIGAWLENYFISVPYCDYEFSSQSLNISKRLSPPSHRS